MAERPRPQPHLNKTSLISLLDIILPDMHLSGTVVLQPRVRLRDGRANVPFAGDAAGGRASLPSFTQRSLHEPDEQLAEAKALVTCIPGWHVVGEVCYDACAEIGTNRCGAFVISSPTLLPLLQRIVPVRAVEGSTYFGKGRLSELAEVCHCVPPPRRSASVA